MSRCPYCGNASVAEQRLCVTCLDALKNHWEMNQIVVDAYIDAGVTEMVAYLVPWAEFTQWLVNHDSPC